MSSLLGSMRDLLPIVLVIAFFQIVVLQQTPEHLLQIFIGLLFVVLGLTFFYFWSGAGPVSDWRIHGACVCQ